MRLYKAFFVTILFWNLQSYSQTDVQSTAEKDPIATDRPDQTETPSLVPKGMFQMENGFAFERTDDNANTIASPSSLLKFGVNDHFELRLIAEYITYQTDFGDKSRLEPMLIGLKVKLSEEKGVLPKTSFIAHLSLPFLSTEKFGDEGYAPEFRFTMQHTISDKIGLGYNLGAEWDGETTEPTFIYTLTTAFSVSEKAGVFIEVYGFSPEKDKADHRFDGGFTYLLSNNFMLDVSGGAGITENAPDYFGSIGFSFRL